VRLVQVVAVREQKAEPLVLERQTQAVAAVAKVTMLVHQVVVAQALLFFQYQQSATQAQRQAHQQSQQAAQIQF
jgi:hypothetical protein